MHRRFLPASVTRLTMLLGFVAASSLPAQHVTVDRLAWMSGCWRQTSASGRVVDEQWMAPRGGTMLGMSRTVRGDSLVEFEQLRISERGGNAVYHAAPMNQTPTDFTAESTSDTLVVFENPQHDFPQRIIYRKRGADSVVARIEGTTGGARRGFDFPYAKVRCPGS